MSALAATAPSTERIPLVDLPAQYRSIQAEIDAVMQDVVSRGAFTLGPELRAFEAAFAEYCGAAYGIGVGSGTDALALALRALGAGPGDEVIVPGMTFAATATTVVNVGATPVFVDVRPGDLQIDPEAVRAAITPRTIGLLPVHLYGMAADVEALGSVAESHGLWLLEDAAQAHGTEVHGARAGSFGQAACFSFYPGKNLGAYGDGGMVVTSDATLADRLRLLRDHGQAAKYQHVLVGYCSRLDNLQAAVLGVKLRYLDEWTAARRAAAAIYDELIGERVERVGKDAREGAVHHIYAVRVPDGQRDAVLAALKARGVEASIHYPEPVHKLQAFQEMGYQDVSLPVAEQAGRELLSLPIYPEITRVQQERVVEALFAALNAAGV